MTDVALSIIVCTRNRAQHLVTCLDSIAISITHANLENAELVIVDNGSSDNTSSVISAWSGMHSHFNVQYIYEPQPGLSVARNRGVRHAKGRLIVFTDDDCRLSQTYISELLSYDATDVSLIMRSGSVVLGDPGDLPITVKPVNMTRRWTRPMSLADEGTILGGSLIGCNMAMRKDVIEKIGLFDENLGAGTACPAGEDTDYFYRAYLADVTLEIVPDLVIAHYHGRKTIIERTKLLRNYAVGNGALSIKYLFIYPNFARHLIWTIKSAFSSLFSPQADRGAWITRPDQMKFMFIGAGLYVKYATQRFFRGLALSRPVNSK